MEERKNGNNRLVHSQEGQAELVSGTKDKQQEEGLQITRRPRDELDIFV